MDKEAALLQELHGLRLDAPGLAENALALGVGLFLAVLIGAVLARFRKRPQRRNWTARAEASRDLPRDERITVLATLLRELTDQIAPGPERWTERAGRLGVPQEALQNLSESLYRADGAGDGGALEQAVLRAARRAEG